MGLWNIFYFDLCLEYFFYETKAIIQSFGHNIKTGSS